MRNLLLILTFLFLVSACGSDNVPIRSNPVKTASIRSNISSSHKEYLPTVLWVGPWYDPAHPFTVDSAVRNYGVESVMYDLDWVDFNYSLYNNKPYSLTDYLSFCQARIAEAQRIGAKLWFSTVQPFEPYFSVSQRAEIWLALAPCIDNPAVLGIYLPDEPDAITGMTTDSESLGQQVFKQIYPNKLTWQNITARNLPSAPQWAAIGDVFSEDYYLDPEDHQFGLKYLEKLTAASKFLGNRSGYFIHGAFNSSLLFNNTHPLTSKHLTQMVEMASAQGIQGVCWWGAWYDPDHVPIPQIAEFQLPNPSAPDSSLRAVMRAVNTTINNQNHINWSYLQ